MRIGSQEWYDLHPDAPTLSDIGDELEQDRNARRAGVDPSPPPVTGVWAEMLEQARQNAMEASREG